MATRSNNIEDVYELSPMQEGMLFHSLQESSEMYTVQINYSLNTILKIEAVRQSFHQLVRRHTILRTVFNYEQMDRAIQIVLREREPDFTYIDLRPLIFSEITKQVSMLRQQDFKKRFDLCRDALMRLTLLQVDENKYELIWSYHHIVMDGWGCSVLIKEFWVIYESLLTNTDNKLKPAPPFRNYILWLQDRDQQESIRYWQSYLSGYSYKAGFPRIHERKDEEFDPETQELSLREIKSNALRALSASSQVTVNILMQTAWGILLSHYSGTKDVVFGSVVSGRPAALKGVEEMVGLFINTVPVRLQYKESYTVKELLSQVQHQALESQVHHYCQLAQIQASSSLGRELFDHVIILENYPTDEEILGEIKNTAIQQDPQQTAYVNTQQKISFPLNLTVIPAKNIVLKLIFDNKVYEPILIERLLSQYWFILQQFLDDEHLTIEAILNSLRSEQEKKSYATLRENTRQILSEDF